MAERLSVKVPDSRLELVMVGDGWLLGEVVALASNSSCTEEEFSLASTVSFSSEQPVEFSPSRGGDLEGRGREAAGGGSDFSCLVDHTND